MENTTYEGGDVKANTCPETCTGKEEQGNSNKSKLIHK